MGINLKVAQLKICDTHGVKVKNLVNYVSRYKKLLFMLESGLNRISATTTIIRPLSVYTYDLAVSFVGAWTATTTCRTMCNSTILANGLEPIGVRTFIVKW